MGDKVLSDTAYTDVKQKATAGGAKSATHHAEERARSGSGIDPLVDPKGPPHLGPTRLSLPRFTPMPNGLYRLVLGMAMPEETALDTTGSMGNNVNIAFHNLPHAYRALKDGSKPVFGRYDIQVATSIFNDIEDLDEHPNMPVICRSQFEMDEKIAEQLTHMAPIKDGCGNGKEDPQLLLFGAAYLTNARITQYGLKSYHYVISDEPCNPWIDPNWITRVYGDDVFEHTRKNGFTMDPRRIPDTAQAVKDLLTRANAFFLQVPDGYGDYRTDVYRQWCGLYGKERVVQLPEGTRHIHLVKAVIGGLTEGVLGLTDAYDFLREHDADMSTARAIVRAVANIPLGAQAALPNFDKIPLAGTIFRNRTDLWPMTPKEIAAHDAELETNSATRTSSGINWGG